MESRMDNSLYVLIGSLAGAFITGLTSLLSSRIIMRNQALINNQNNEKDIFLQTQNLDDSRISSEIKLHREKLEKFLLILSKIEFENSLTASYFQSDENTDIEVFRKDYRQNCYLFHEAQAIANLYLPEISKPMQKVYGEMNMYWGHQEAVIRANKNSNKEFWQHHLNNVTNSAMTINDEVNAIRNLIIIKAEKLSELINKKHAFEESI